MLQIKRGSKAFEERFVRPPSPPLYCLPTRLPSSTMFIIERDDDDDCMEGTAGCMPMYAIMGPNPSEKTDDVASSGPPQYEEPGPHRFIGVAAVAGLAFLIFVAYLVFGRWPRRMRRKYCRCLGGRSDDDEEEDSVEKGKSSTKRGVAVFLESASASSAEEIPHRHSRSMSDYRTDIDRRSKSRRRSSRNRRPRSNVTIPDGGAVVERKSVDVESGAMVTGWEVEHVGGVRYEVSSSSSTLLSASAYTGPPTGSYTDRSTARAEA